MAYPSPSCLCSRPTLRFPSVCHVNCVVPTLDIAYPSPSCLCSRSTLHYGSDALPLFVFALAQLFIPTLALSDSTVLLQVVFVVVQLYLFLQFAMLIVLSLR
jgi:hypothetical protein